MMHVEESGLPGGSTPDKGVSAKGGMTISAPDGVGSITINGVTVWSAGKLVNDTIDVPNGKLVVDFDAAKGELSYTYTLTQTDTHHKAGSTGSDDQVAHEILVSVTDSDGDVGQGVIRVEVGDDGPSLVTLTPNAAIVADQNHTISGTLTFVEGADGVKSMSVTVEGDGTDQTFTGSKSDTGVWTFKDSSDHTTENFTYKDGVFSYTRPSDTSDGAQNDTIKISATVTDADGDTAASSTVTVSTIAKPVIGTVSPLTVDEGDLQNGSHKDNDSTTPFTATAEGSFALQLHG